MSTPEDSKQELIENHTANDTQITLKTDIIGTSPATLISTNSDNISDTNTIDTEIKNDEPAIKQIKVISPDGDDITSNNGDGNETQTIVEITQTKLKSLSVTDREIQLENLNEITKDRTDIHINDGTSSNDGTKDKSTLDIPNNESSSDMITKHHSAALRLEAEYRIDEKTHPWFRGYIRQDWQTISGEEGELEELRAEWIELFFDLMFVAIIVHISSQAAYAWDKRSHFYLFTIFSQFAMIIMLWQEQVMYESRFVMNQLMDDWLRFLFMAFILALGLSVGDNELLHKEFLFCYCICKIAAGFMYYKVYLIPRSRKHAIYMLIEKIIIVIACFVCALAIDVSCSYKKCFWSWNQETSDTYYDDNHRRLAGGSSDGEVYTGKTQEYHNRMSLIYFTVYTCIFVFSNFYLIDISFMKCVGQVSIPLNIPHIAERFGLFVMLILGESIISLMTANLRTESIDMLKDYGLLIGAFIIVYAIGRLYFQCQPTEEQIMEGSDKHAMRAGRLRAKLFGISHTILYLALLAFGIGTKITANNLEGNERKKVFVMLPGFSLAIICACMNSIRIAHPSKNPPWFIWLFRAILIFIMVVCAFFWEEVNNGVILLIYIIAVLLQLFIDFEGKEMSNEKKKILKKKALETANNSQHIEERRRHFKTRTFTSGRL